MINPITGEVINYNGFGSYIPTERISSNPGNRMRKQFKELAPFAKDLKTGKFLNESPKRKIVESTPVDYQEYIESFADETDIYKILERCVATGSMEPLQMRKDQVAYGDISDMPDNFNELHELVDKAKELKLDELMEELRASKDEKALKSTDVDTLKKLINGEVTAALTAGGFIKPTEEVNK